MIPSAAPPVPAPAESVVEVPGSVLPDAKPLKPVVVNQPTKEPVVQALPKSDVAVRKESLHRSFLLDSPPSTPAVVEAEPLPPVAKRVAAMQPSLPAPPPIVPAPAAPAALEPAVVESLPAAVLAVPLPSADAPSVDGGAKKTVPDAVATATAPALAAAPLPDEPVPADPGPSAASAASPERAPAAAPLPAPLLPEPVAAEPEAVVLEEGEPLPEAMPGPVGAPLPEPVAGVAIPDAESETRVDGEPPKPQPSVESVALPEELRIGVVQEPPSALQEAPSREILVKDESLAEEPGPEAPSPEPAPARPGMPPPHDLAPWALVESEDGALPVFDSSMPVIRNEVARLQLEEWSRHVGEAVARHPSVRAAEYAEQESISSIGEAKAQLYPQVSLGLNTDLRRSIRDGKPYATVSDLPVDDEIRLNPNLTVRQLVFDGGATSSRGKAAMARSLAARERRVSTEEGVALRAVATMIELAKLQEQLEFARENLSEVRRLRDMIRARVDAGRDAPSEMLQMNSRVFEARNEVVLLEGRRAEAGARYEEVFGGTPVVLAFPDVFAPIPMSMSGGMDAALRKNPDLLSSKALVDAAAADYKAAWGALYPRLEVEANLTVYDVTRNESDYYDSFVGLKLSHNILDGGLKSSTKARTRSQMERARSEYDNTQRAVELALRRAYANREALIPQYKALQAQLDHKRETQRAYEEQFLAGRRPLNDLVAAQQQVIDTAIRTLDYKAELHRQHFVILSLIGELAKGEGKKM
ncbi:MAG: hypothetical protein A3K90_02065 [Pelodictyon luteolum]|uniref:Outer membrane efflux protein n=1 Tax=Pelodictyon luteolum TaxID=1100 RepID=A0A165KZU0_PELLU|nr:TolC family protein [Pelodictyon luteolum]KZK73398.1 MAG: hypothetical protein A3K90_02065 [Pelodictyon luteolum]